MGKGRVLRIFDTKAVFENYDTGNCLVVSQIKDTGARHIERMKSENLPDLGVTSQVVPLEGIFGFYDLLSGSYVALVVESESYVSLETMTIRKTKKILVVPLFRNGRNLSESRQKEEERYLHLLHIGFTEHQFFFSFKSDITLTQQKQAKLTQKQLSEPLWARADHNFFWNHELVVDLINANADDWIVPFMSAYVEIADPCPIDDIKCTLLFISRRSRYRQGCRFVRRGLDEHGAVGNFVETEQILVFPDGRVTAYVQVRGSIPVKWCSPVHMRYDPAVFIEEDRAKSADWAEKHISDLLEQYSDNAGNSGVIFVNLVDNKKDQGRLGVAFKEVVDEVRARVQPHSLTYVWFDFHHECKQKGKWNNLSKLILQVDELFRAQKFFSKLPTGVVTSWQVGVIRTNCMDNLDRTNVVQSLFARRSLVHQAGKNKSIDLSDAKNVLDTPWKPLEKMFKSVWTNNANAMSLGYAGTGALKVDFTKTGKRTIKGMCNDGVNSCMRYYINNFTDGVKQDAIDLMLGNYRPDPAGPSPFTQRTAQQSLASNLTKLFVLLLTVFAVSLLIMPPMGMDWSAVPGGSDGSTVTDAASVVEANLTRLRSQFLLALTVALVVAAYLMHAVVKRGSKIGERLVVHPELCPEPLPAGRGQ